MQHQNARSEAVRIVDERHGYTYEFSNTPGMHLEEYDEEEARIRAANSQEPCPFCDFRPSRAGA